VIKGLFINLDRSVARRAHMEKNAAAAGVDMTRLPAVDGLTLSAAEFDRVHPPQPHLRRMTRSEVACFLSHRKAWEQICQGAADYGAVFEDDIDFGTNLQAVLSDTAWIRPDMDLIKLDKATRKHVEFGEKITIEQGLDVKRLLSLHVGCGGYVISKAFARELLAASETFHVPIDHFLFNPAEDIFRQAGIWQAMPAVCLHQQFSDTAFLPADAELSSLQTSRKETIRHHQKQGGRLVFVLRKLGREIARPFLSLGRYLSKRISGFRRGTTWERIDYKRDRLISR
jgi:glycosyl transferase, family 25